MAFKASPSSQYQHCTDEAQKAETVLSAVIYIYIFIIHQIFSLARDWSKHVTWANIPQLKVGNIRGYSSIFKTDG